jgi:hypothetical protein
MRIRILFLILCAAFFSYWHYLSRSAEQQRIEAEARAASLRASAQHPPMGDAGLGSPILKDYAKPERTVQQDLTDFSRVLSNYALLHKQSHPLPQGANEEIAAALLGKKAKTEPFLKPTDACFNAQGQLIDRWQTPLYFHAQDHSRMDIRSAGPDREMWTLDDIHRRNDGRFVRQEELLAPSLFESMKNYR